MKNSCWSNGVKLQEVTDFSTPALPIVEITATKNGNLCYTMDGAATPGITGELKYVVDDASGARLGFYSINPATGERSIECLVGGSFVIPGTCQATSTSTSTDGGCSTGVCTQ